MSENSQETQIQEVQKTSDKEFNFRKQEESYKRLLDQERQARIAAEEKIQQMYALSASKANSEEDDDSDEPYIDKKRLEKRLGNVVKQVANDTDSKIHNAVQQALANERKNQWLKNNPDFNEVMSHAQTFADKDPELAETILEMPEGFERQKLVYKNIKALGLHRKPEDQPKIQDKINQNRQGGFYQPTGVASPGYGVYSSAHANAAEGKNAYAKMVELRKRIGG